MRFNLALVGCLCLLALGACSREDGIPVDKTIAVNEPNRFAQFINPIAGLPAGDYTVVAATTNANMGDAGSFVLTVTFDDGEIQEFASNWISSGGQDETSPNNPSFNLTLYNAGGISIRLESTSVDTYLYLLFASNGAIVDEDNDSADGTNSLIAKDASRIDSEEYGAAYYAAIDPNNAKTTLEDWKVMNGFYDAESAGRVFEPRFRDTKDLGYGRGIRGWTKPDGSLYFFVENFQVRTVPGLEYSTLNLDALILDDRQHHFGSNAIEYSTYPYGPGEPSDIGGGAKKFLKFFTFDATQGDQTAPDHANETRLNVVNLDGRGNKAMPGACVYCHGGTLRPLRPDGTFRDNTLNGTSGNGLNGDTNAKFQLMEATSFDYWPEQPYTQAEQELIIKEVNKLIYCTYPGAHPSACAEYCVDPADTANCGGAGIDVAAVVNCIDPANSVDCDGRGNNLAAVMDPAYEIPGTWTGEFAVEMAEGWYDDPATGDGTGIGSDMIPDFDSDFFRQDYVPLEWRPNVVTGNPPAGADQLFVEVIQPVCFVCHSRRGTTLGSNTAANGSKDIDFSSWDKFIAHSDLIEEYVYERGVMPLSLRGYKAFWATDDPQLLASFLPGFSHANADGSIDQPGAPVADAGPDRTMPSPARMFGSNSRFASTYSWSIVSTPVGGEAATLSKASTKAALLTAPVDGDYTLRLTVDNGLAQTDQDEVIIKIDSFMPVEPKDLVFSTGAACTNTDVEICTIMQNAAPTGGNCISCHKEVLGIAGIPVWWTDAQPATSALSLYEEALARVDFNEPEKSPLLRKPSGHQHYGGQTVVDAGFDTSNPANRQHYDTILNWIMEGARKN